MYATTLRGTVKDGAIRFDSEVYATLNLAPLEGQRVKVTVRHAPAHGGRTNKLPKRAQAPKVKLPKMAGDHRERVKYADGLCRRIARERAGSPLCEVCLKRPWHDMMHGFAKGPYPALRHDLDNLAMGCRSCHRRIDSDHHAKEVFWRGHIGPERYERLRLRAQSRAKADLALVILELERLVA